MPDFELEDNWGGLIAGVDEAGRGPWAGPVVAGAVIIRDRCLGEDLLGGLDDSKKLTARRREFLYEKLYEAQEQGKLCIGIGQASAAEIDEFNILQATFMAMQRAVDALPLKPEKALLDGNRAPRSFSYPVRTVIKGDGRSYSIAAASIAAKVYRDRLMAELAQRYPGYGFEKNAGYGTAAHIAGLQKYGLIPEHRKSYKPVREYLLRQAG